MSEVKGFLKGFCHHVVISFFLGTKLYALAALAAFESTSQQINSMVSSVVAYPLDIIDSIQVGFFSHLGMVGSIYIGSCGKNSKKLRVVPAGKFRIIVVSMEIIFIARTLYFGLSTIYQVARATPQTFKKKCDIYAFQLCVFVLFVFIWSILYGIHTNVQGNVGLYNQLWNVDKVYSAHRIYGGFLPPNYYKKLKRRRTNGFQRINGNGQGLETRPQATISILKFEQTNRRDTFDFDRCIESLSVFDTVKGRQTKFLLVGSIASAYILGTLSELIYFWFVLNNPEAVFSPFEFAIRDSRFPVVYLILELVTTFPLLLTIGFIVGEYSFSGAPGILGMSSMLIILGETLPSATSFEELEQGIKLHNLLKMLMVRLNDVLNPNLLPILQTIASAALSGSSFYILRRIRLAKRNQSYGMDMYTLFHMGNMLTFALATFTIFKLSGSFVIQSTSLKSCLHHKLLQLRIQGARDAGSGLRETLPSATSFEELEQGIKLHNLLKMLMVRLNDVLNPNLLPILQTIASAALSGSSYYILRRIRLAKRNQSYGMDMYTLFHIGNMVTFAMATFTIFKLSGSFVIQSTSLKSCLQHKLLQLRIQGARDAGSGLRYEILKRQIRALRPLAVENAVDGRQTPQVLNHFFEKVVDITQNLLLIF